VSIIVKELRSNYPRLEKPEIVKPHFLFYVYGCLIAGTAFVTIFVPFEFWINYLQASKKARTPLEADLYFSEKGYRFFETGNGIMSFLLASTILFLIVYSIFYSEIQIKRGRAFLLALVQAFVIGIFSTLAIGMRGI